MSVTIHDPEIEKRDRAIKRIGLPSYSDYLKSELWRSIKERVYRKKGRLCVLCGKKASCVHHNLYGYKTLCGLNLKPLHPLCLDCHQGLHYTGKQYVPLKVARARFWSIMEGSARVFPAR